MSSYRLLFLWVLVVFSACAPAVPVAPPNQSPGATIIAAPAPSVPRAVAPVVLSGPAPTVESHLFLRAVSADGSTLRIHRLGDQSLLLSRGLSMATLGGAALQWDATLSRGLPRIWDEAVVPEIGVIAGKTLSSSWLGLVAGCASAPSASGYPVPFEFTRTESGWVQSAAPQRRLWRGGRYYSFVPKQFGWKNRSYLLRTAENPANWLDGQPSEEDLASQKYCLGTALITDTAGHSVSEPRLPKDLCVIDVVGQNDSLWVAGWDGRGQLQLEVRDSKRVQRFSPALRPDCSLLQGEMVFHWAGNGSAHISGKQHCSSQPEGSDQEVSLQFTGHEFTAGGSWDPLEDLRHAAETAQQSYFVADGVLYGKTAEHWEALPFPALSGDLLDNFVAPPRAEAVFESHGVGWVLASSGAAACMSYQGEAARLLYSTAPGPREDAQDLPVERELRYLVGPDCRGATSVALLVSSAPGGRFSDVAVERWAKSKGVPARCGLVEFLTQSQHALGVLPLGDPACERFVRAALGPVWCVPPNAISGGDAESLASFHLEMRRDLPE